MRRTIEERIENRKKHQEKLKDTLTRLGDLLAGRLRGRNRRLATELMEELYSDISGLVTAQDREWDAYSNNHASRVFSSLHWKIDTLEAEYANVRALVTGFLHLEQSLKNLIERIDNAGEVTPEDRGKLEAARERLTTFRYSDFEARFRGSRESVSAQLGRYVEQFAPVDDILDLGCGRGEFVSMLLKAGKSAEGVDLSRTMLDAATEQGLPCRRADLLKELRARPESSLGGLFSSQVIEHLPSDYLKNMVEECGRVLRPGGILIMETVNPLSLFALSRIFFLDVTHNKPLHPDFMRYLLENRGFHPVEILYGDPPPGEALEEISPDHESARAWNSNVDKLNTLLYGPSVYAVKGVRG